MQKSMTSGNSLKLLLTFMVPLIIGNIFQQMYSISDIIIVGRTIGVNGYVQRSDGHNGTVLWRQ